jgi:hypothetical protein
MGGLPVPRTTGPPGSSQLVVAWSEAAKTAEFKGAVLAMRAAIFKGPGAVEPGERPDPVIQQPTDAIVRVALG